jgi:hypothetical protein
MLHAAVVPIDETRRRPKTGRPEGPETLQMTAYVDPELHERYRLAAAKYRTSISAYVEAAMRAFEAAGGLAGPPPPRATSTTPAPEKPAKRKK